MERPRGDPVMYRSHELVIQVWRADHLARPWAWECPSDHCLNGAGTADTQAEALQAACQHLADAFDDHHQVAHAHEGSDTSDSYAQCRCGTERTGRHNSNAAETDLEWHISLAEEGIPAAYRKPTA